MTLGNERFVFYLCATHGSSVGCVGQVLLTILCKPWRYDDHLRDMMHLYFDHRTSFASIVIRAGIVILIGGANLCTHRLDSFPFFDNAVLVRTTLLAFLFYPSLEAWLIWWGHRLSQTDVEPHGLAWWATHKTCWSCHRNWRKQRWTGTARMVSTPVRSGFNPSD